VIRRCSGRGVNRWRSIAALGQARCYRVPPEYAKRVLGEHLNCMPDVSHHFGNDNQFLKRSGRFWKTSWHIICKQGLARPRTTIEHVTRHHSRSSRCHSSARRVPTRAIVDTTRTGTVISTRLAGAVTAPRVRIIDLARSQGPASP
jgi:hypothetical protein